jgi:CheY-like chemotaxis protein
MQRGVGPVSSGRILIVDDDDAIRLMLADLFGDEGYDVSTAPDGQYALELAKQQRFDVILFDMSMPVMDGRQLVQELRENQIRVPLVAMTAARGVGALAKEVAATAYFTKPFDVDAVVTTIAKIVGPSGTPT